MTEQPSRSDDFLAELSEDLTVVHSYYLYLLESSFGHEVPVPMAIAHDTDVLHRFVQLLDRAVTPQMIRDGLHFEEHRKAAEALLRFFAAKPQRGREDRDKADVIATALFRSLVWEDAGELQEAENTQATLALETDLRRIYRNVPMPEPPNEHMQLVREFDRLRIEVDAFRHFDELTDSGLIQKVRDIKQALEASFLHPRVLSVMASYNVFFHQKFDVLFIQAAKDVKKFAAMAQRDGGSMMTPADGNATLKQLAEVSQAKILNEEYSLAQQDLRQISQLKVALDNQRLGKPAAQIASPPPAPALRVPAASASIAIPADRAASPNIDLPSTDENATPSANRPGPSNPPAYVMPRSSSSVADVEAQALLGVHAAIRSFVRSADAQSAQVVPLPHGNITLTNAEVEAFRADYGDEKSFRGDFVSSLMQMAALDARLLAQLQAFEATRETTYNWKPHADALAHLLSIGRDIVDHAMQVAVLAKQRGLNDKASALLESIEKIRPRGLTTVEALQSINSSNE